MKKNNTYSVKYNMFSFSNKLIEDDKFEFDTKEKAKEFINTQVDNLTSWGLYKVIKKSDDYVVLNSYDKQYSTKLELIENTFS